LGVRLATDAPCDEVARVAGKRGGSIDVLALGLLALDTNGFHAFLRDLKLTYNGRKDDGVLGLPCPC
jgi:hypothetical protein